jgi:hypothetical protein
MRYPAGVTVRRPDGTVGMVVSPVLGPEQRWRSQQGDTYVLWDQSEVPEWWTGNLTPVPADTPRGQFTPGQQVIVTKSNGKNRPAEGTIGTVLDGDYTGFGDPMVFWHDYRKPYKAGIQKRLVKHFEPVINGAAAEATAPPQDLAAFQMHRTVIRDETIIATVDRENLRAWRNASGYSEDTEMQASELGDFISQTDAKYDIVTTDHVSTEWVDYEPIHRLDPPVGGVFHAPTAGLYWLPIEEGQ